MTMHDAVAVNGRLRDGESVLVLGASSGVGLMALRIARHLGAAQVIGTSTDPTRRAGLATFGADLAIDTAVPDFPVVSVPGRVATSEPIVTSASPE